MRLNNALRFYSGKQTRGWPPERRIVQSARTRARQIWRLARGPVSAAGKERSAYNALKHGHYRAAWRDLRRALAQYRRFLKWAQAVLSAIKSHKNNALKTYRLVGFCPHKVAEEDSFVFKTFCGMKSYD